MTNTSKLAMLLDELREAGATSEDVAGLLLATGADVAADRPRRGRPGTHDAMVRILLQRSMTAGWLNKAPWQGEEAA